MAKKSAAKKAKPAKQQSFEQTLWHTADKLRGTDFDEGEELTVPRQVSKLISQAQNPENLAVSYVGVSLFFFFSFISFSSFFSFSSGVLSGDFKAHSNTFCFYHFFCRGSLSLSTS